jgi:hypothetical protein
VKFGLFAFALEQVLYFLFTKRQDACPPIRRQSTHDLMPDLMLAHGQLHLVALQDVHVLDELWKVVALTVLLSLHRFRGR